MLNPTQQTLRKRFENHGIFRHYVTSRKSQEMANKKRRREQAPKGGANKALVRAMQGKRSSNASGPHRADNDYRRKPKHVNRQEW